MRQPNLTLDPSKIIFVMQKETYITHSSTSGQLLKLVIEKVGNFLVQKWELQIV